VLGDQLAPDSAAMKSFDPERDRIWMAEAREEATHVWSSKMRIAYFLSAMRHFRDELASKGYNVTYHTLKPDAPSTLAEILAGDRSNGSGGRLPGSPIN
jgi:deoxyribodipyrimidine photolyase-related protein